MGGRRDQASSTILSWFSWSSDKVFLVDLEEDVDALLALRGGFVVVFFSGDASLRLSDFNADRVRFLPCASAGLDDSRLVGISPGGACVCAAVIVALV